MHNRKLFLKGSSLAPNQGPRLRALLPPDPCPLAVGRHRLRDVLLIQMRPLSGGSHSGGWVSGWLVVVVTCGWLAGWLVVVCAGGWWWLVVAVDGWWWLVVACGCGGGWWPVVAGVWWCLVAAGGGWLVVVVADGGWWLMNLGIQIGVGKRMNAPFTLCSIHKSLAASGSSQLPSSCMRVFRHQGILSL